MKRVIRLFQRFFDASLKVALPSVSGRSTAVLFVTWTVLASVEGHSFYFRWPFLLVSWAVPLAVLFCVIGRSS